MKDGFVRVLSVCDVLFRLNVVDGPDEVLCEELASQWYSDCSIIGQPYLLQLEHLAQRRVHLKHNGLGNGFEDL